ncbi:hypothetical protein [Muricoccus radiodurans]|uniref:hypothetical protein n=1 Tax=Muricoccus radiodurans TaxID=2231721 RepID=UPI003CF15041
MIPSSKAAGPGDPEVPPATEEIEMSLFSRLSARSLAILAAVGVSACAVAPGPYEQQAAAASQACYQGYTDACYQAQALQPAAAAERNQAQQNAQVGTAVAAGLIGAAAGAAIVSSSRPYYGRPYYGRGYYRRW